MDGADRGTIVAVSDSRVAYVTGAATGIGLAIASKLYSAGYRLIVHHHSSADPATLLGPRDRVASVRGDFTSSSDVRKCARDALEQFGRVDVVVNNAGIALPDKKPSWLVPEHDWLRVLQVNFHAPVETCSVLVPSMRARKWGRIVNIASSTVGTCSPGSGAYTVSKAALIKYGEVLSKEIGRFNVTVNSVSPGFTLTTMGRRAMEKRRERSAGDAEEFVRTYPLGRLCEPEQVAAVVGFVCSPEADAMTGQNYVVNCGNRIETFNLPEKVFPGLYDG
jgi:NAD(P)-dependent dehydrogenase (short-subunit alcohol dehydrogenase family)